MASYFFDSSALVKRYVKETGTVWVTSLIDPANGHEIFLARISGVEVLSAIKRRERVGTTSPQDAQAAISNFRADFPFFFTLLEIGSLMITEAMSLAERYDLRGYDAVQLAAHWKFIVVARLWACHCQHWFPPIRRSMTQEWWRA